MDIKIFDSPEEVDLFGARMIVELIKSKPSAVIGLSTGRTTKGLHREIVRLYNEERFDISGITFFGQDEVLGVSEQYSGACVRMLRDELIDELGVKDDNFIMLPTESEDPQGACWKFTQTLMERGGVDLLFLGLGENGHLGFNQPGTPFSSRARVSTMTPELESRIRRETGTPPGKYLGGITMGLADVMDCRKLVLGVKGSAKARILRKVIEGPITERVPATVLRTHPDCTVIADREASQLLGK